jgi:hypothetical protein
MGATGTRLSLRPPFSWAKIIANPRAPRAAGGERVSELGFVKNEHHHVTRHSGAMRSIEPQMRNCASGNLEIPGLVLRTIPE